MKTLVITGVTRGLGRAMAEEFIRLGHVVLGCGRSEKDLGELRRRFGKWHEFDRVDVASDEQVEAWAKRLLGSRGAPDLVLNNAGVINRNAPLWKVSSEEFGQVIDHSITAWSPSSIPFAICHWPSRFSTANLVCSPIVRAPSCGPRRV